MATRDDIIRRLVDAALSLSMWENDEGPEIEYNREQLTKKFTVILKEKEPDHV